MGDVAIIIWPNKKGAAGRRRVAVALYRAGAIGGNRNLQGEARKVAKLSRPRNPGEQMRM
jgi:hypothetical protein